ncbi:GNAT family N-acetyltransferase [Actinoplanes sp. NPDC026623]|uniref:GNAT family N-acetyltransferase n=1 Tax=Actinoplanes sp. NPDC026623 TaxID=3155610 RepID=UPI0033E7522F
MPRATGGLTLRPWRDDDAAALIVAADDPMLRRWTKVRAADADEAREWLGVQHRGWQAGDRYSFAVLDDGQRLVANVALKLPDPGAGVAEVGYWTAGYARGQGVAPRALAALTGWVFATFPGLRRLDLLHQIDNTASCRVAQKCGYPYEATLRAEAPYPREGHLHVRYQPVRDG